MSKDLNETIENVAALNEWVQSNVVPAIDKGESIKRSFSLLHRPIESRICETLAAVEKEREFAEQMKARFSAGEIGIYRAYVNQAIGRLEDQRRQLQTAWFLIPAGFIPILLLLKILNVSESYLIYLTPLMVILLIIYSAAQLKSLTSRRKLTTLKDICDAARPRPSETE